MAANICGGAALAMEGKKDLKKLVEKNVRWRPCRDVRNAREGRKPGKKSGVWQNLD